MPRLKTSHPVLMRPQLPTAAMLLPLLEEMDRHRIYSNFGPFVQQFQSQLESHFHLPEGSLITVSNGTAGLTLALQTFDIRAGQFCLMPSWTFTGTASAVMAAGLIPYFIDVNPLTGALDSFHVEQILEKSGLPVGAILVVSPFGLPIQGKIWDQLTEKTGIPVVIDAAAGFDSLSVTKTPVMVSLHATKAFGVGEGGFVSSTNKAFMEKFKQKSMFGFQKGRTSEICGMNGKMSEFSAIVGLAMLDMWPQVRRQLHEVSQIYQNDLASFIGTKISFQPEWGRQWISGTCNIFLRAGHARDLMNHLEKNKIPSRQWWEKPLHQHQAYKIMPHEPLPVTESLGHRVLGLPFYGDLEASTIHRICDLVGSYLSSQKVSFTEEEKSFFSLPLKKSRGSFAPGLPRKPVSRRALSRTTRMSYPLKGKVPSSLKTMKKSPKKASPPYDAP